MALRRALLAATLLAPAPSALAQISPGKLSASHAALEGNTQCFKCHEPGRGVAPDRCLTCHEALRLRIGAARGLHARPEYRACKTCHVEHQGVQYDLVWWGKAGRSAFDHRQTGHALEGRHARLECPACHQPRSQKDREALAKQGVSRERSFLGLDAACLSCHRDEHRGQFAPRPCLSCHTQVGWKPAPGFDHGRTAFPLTGRHLGVSCGGCHKTVASDAAGHYLRFQGPAVKECASCHEDAHKGRLGTSCTSCHTTAAWRQGDRSRFAHDRTGYPLRGRHASVACASCHPAGRPLRVPHEGCTDCHADAHLGQLASRADRGRCESCHDVSGFSPARFSVDDHQKSGYPLTGSHLAVACNGCHKTAGGTRGRTVRLRFASERCADCHSDPHRGEVDRQLRQGGCEACHRAESWKAVSFDHNQTRYPLAGGHARASCTSCHENSDARTRRERLRFTGLAQACEACHRDPHQGQFARDETTACDRCHTVQTLQATRFDHHDAAWSLDGAHTRVACVACHRVETRNGVTFTRYKPLPMTCKGCHGEPATPPKETKG